MHGLISLLDAGSYDKMHFSCSVAGLLFMWGFSCLVLLSCDFVFFSRFCIFSSLAIISLRIREEERSDCLACLFVLLLVFVLMLYIPVSNISLGVSGSLFKQHINVSCSRTQHSDLSCGKSQTSDP